VAACDTCGKHHRGECWHKNKDNKQGNKMFRPGLAGKSSQMMYTMEEIKEFTQLSFAMFGNLDASKKNSKTKRKSGKEECDDEINHMLAKIMIVVDPNLMSMLLMPTPFIATYLLQRRSRQHTDALKLLQ
jgi:hypothetical protein